ncbi:uncharacterized protein Dvar_51420 [Desulfosarcina variabilis str. Montpellier]|uniref:hypothetical protein n=1 Tax=Desulfosarcina variabilis TaxID=2300 RepID=UPI003AFAFA0C
MEKQDILLFITGFSALACVLAIFQRQVLAVVEALFRMVLSPIAVAVTSLEHLWVRMGDVFRQQLASENGSLDAQRIFYEVIGSVMYSISFIFFIFADFHLLLLTLDALGIEGKVEAFPGGTAAITAMAVISSFLFFGLVLWDLAKLSQLAPWHQRLSLQWRKAVTFICLAGLLLSLVTTGLCGYWRGKANQEDSIDPSIPWHTLTNSGGLATFNGSSQASLNVPVESLSSPDAWIPLVVNINIPLLLIMGSCLAGYGVVQLIKFTVLGIVFIASLPSYLVLVAFSYLSRVIEYIYALVVSLIELPVAIGLWILGLFKYKPGEVKTSEPECDATVVSKESVAPDEDEPFVNPYENRKEPFDE